MKRNKEYTDEEIIDKTREHIHSFYDRDMEHVYDPLSKDFVWIGANKLQWTKGLEPFKNATLEESMEVPALISDEEYHILSRDRHLCIVYGRYAAQAVTEDGTDLHASVRVTYIWRLVRDTLEILHIHGSNAQDVPIPLHAAATGDTGFFDYLRGIDYQAVGTEKIEFRDREGNHHFLFPGEVLYLKARRQWCTVYTRNSCFDIRGGISEFEQKLSKDFLRIHKSYLVNIRMIDMVRRYTAVLQGGQELPVSKNRYTGIKETLRKSAC